MASSVVVARKWGNSIGVALPAGAVKKEKIMPNDRVVVSVKRVVPLKAIFGSLKLKQPTEELMKEIRKGWD